MQTLLETPDIETSSEDYARRFAGAAGRYLLDAQRRAVLAVLPVLPGAAVLDVGGGHGQLIPMLTELGFKLTLFGSDPSCWARIEELGLVGSARLVTGDLLKLPFKDRSFDIVTAVRLVSHLERWQQALKEFCRVARSTVVIDYPSTRSLNVLTPLLFGVKKRIEGNTRRYTSFSRADLESVFSEAGFEVKAESKELFLPFVMHRMTKGKLRLLESIAVKCGLTARFGSPVVVRADREERVDRSGVCVQSEALAEGYHDRSRGPFADA
jgi:ubiquinone/menaquinone biosynthesis C-methylase UbiE